MDAAKAQRRALMEAVAQHGTDGRRVHAEQQAAAAQHRKSAIAAELMRGARPAAPAAAAADVAPAVAAAPAGASMEQALLDARRRGAPVEMEGQLRQTMQAPVDRAAQYQASTLSSYEAARGHRDAAGAEYDRLVEQARPLVMQRAEAERQRRLASQQYDDRRLALAERELALRERELTDDEAGVEDLDGMSDAELERRLIGAARAQTEQAAASAAEARAGYDSARQQASSDRAKVNPAIRRAEFGEFERAAGVGPATAGHQQAQAGVRYTQETPEAERARRIGVDAGVPAPRVYGLIDEKPEKKAKPKQASASDAGAALGFDAAKVERERSTTVELPADDGGTERRRPFEDAVATMNDYLSDGYSYEDAVAETARLIEETYGRPYSDTVELVAAMFAGWADV